MEPEYEGHDTISLTPVYGTQYSVIWLKRQDNGVQKVFLFDQKAKAKKLRDLDEVPHEISHRTDVQEMIKSPEAAENLHARLAAEEILRNQDSITVVADIHTPTPMPRTRVPSPEGARARVRTPPPIVPRKVVVGGETNGDEGSKLISELVRAIKIQAPRPNFKLQHLTLTPGDMLEQTRAFRKWLRNFELEIETSNVSDANQKKKWFKNIIGAGAVEKIKEWPGNKNLQFDDKDVYEQYVIMATNALTLKNTQQHARARFDTVEQREGENTQAFFGRLLEEAELCEFGTEKDQRIKDRMLAGSNDEKFTDKVILENLNLEEAVNYASLLTSLRAGKKSKAVNYTPRRDQANQPRPNQEAERRADFRPDRGYNQRYRPGNRFTRDDSRNNQRYSQCVFCMRTHTPGDCPAKDLECHRCGQKGHFIASNRCRENSYQRYDRRDNSRGYQPERRQSYTPPPTRNAGYRGQSPGPQRPINYVHNNASQFPQDISQTEENEIIQSNPFMESAVRHLQEQPPDSPTDF